MKDAIKQHDDKEALAAALENVAAIVRSDACHATHEQLVSAVELVSRMTSPSNLLTSYQVCRELNGITPRTLYNYVDAGYVPQPHQLPGAGNTNFWYSDEIKEAKSALVKRRII